MSDILIRALGWRATMVHGDPCVVDRWRFAERHMRPGPLRTLDAGAGNGGFAFLSAKKGNAVVALSFSKDEMARAQRRAASVRMHRVMFRVGDLRQLDAFRDQLGEFDQILCLEVIEHMIADQALLEQLASLLRPGGQLLISAPSADHHALFRESVSTTEDGGHVRWGYAPDQLRNMLDSAGLRVVAQGGVSGYVSQKLTNLMRRAQMISPAVGWLVVLPLRPLQFLDRPLTRALRWPFLSVTAVAIRPG